MTHGYGLGDVENFFDNNWVNSIYQAGDMRSGIDIRVRNRSYS